MSEAESRLPVQDRVFEMALALLDTIAARIGREVAIAIDANAGARRRALALGLLDIDSALTMLLDVEGVAVGKARELLTRAVAQLDKLDRGV